MANSKILAWRKKTKFEQRLKKKDRGEKKKLQMKEPLKMLFSIRGKLRTRRGVGAGAQAPRNTFYQSDREPCSTNILSRTKCKSKIFFSEIFLEFVK